MTSSPWRGCVDEDRAAATFRVHRRAFTSDDVLARENRAIVDRCWILGMGPSN
jgi:hypothetical protein